VVLHAVAGVLEEAFVLVVVEVEVGVVEEMLDELLVGAGVIVTVEAGAVTLDEGQLRFNQMLPPTEYSRRSSDSDSSRRNGSDGSGRDRGNGSRRNGSRGRNGDGNSRSRRCDTIDGVRS